MMHILDIKYVYEVHMATTIVIDAGHGGYDNGASYQGRKEKDDVLRLALAVGSILEERGYNVIYTRTDDTYSSPYEKARVGNNNGADYFVSIHRNSSPNPNTYSGVETLVYNDTGIKAAMARNVNEELEKVGFKNLGINERPNLVVLNSTNMPAILIEAGFINTDADNQLFDAKFYEIANAIATGIEDTIAPAPKGYRVQVGLFRVYANAMYLLEELNNQGYDGVIIDTGEYYKVLVGDEANYDDAQILANALSRLGYDTLIVSGITA